MTITTFIIIACVLTTLLAWNNADTMSRLILDPYMVRQHGQIYRMFSSMLLHADYGHLIFNMITLYSFGDIMEFYLVSYYGIELGKIMYLGLFLLMGFLADVPDVYISKSNNRSLGASGAVSGILLFAVMLAPMNKVCLYFAICIPGIVFAGLFLAYSYYMTKKGGTYINHSAHFYGSLAGIIAVIVLFPSIVWDTFRSFLPF
jgi:membrane associated rhomboid family serine protease